MKYHILLKISSLLLFFLIFYSCPISAATKTWTGKTDSSWLNENNWKEGLPSAEDDLIFPQETNNKITQNNFPDNTSFGVIQISGNYVVSGNSIVLAKNKDSTPPQILINSGNVIFSNSIVLQNNTIIDVKTNSSFTINGEIDLDGYDLDLLVDQGASLIKQNQAIRGKGNLAKNSGGKLYLKSPNNFTGWLQIVAGTVNIQHSNVFTNDNYITIRGDSSLELESGSNPLVIDTPLELMEETSNHSFPSLINIRGKNIWKGRISLTSDNIQVTGNPDITVDHNSTLTFENQITGEGGIDKKGEGTLIFSGDKDNTYKSQTYLYNGAIVLSKTNAISIPEVLIVGDGEGANDSDIVLFTAANQIADSAKVFINSSGLFELNGHVETIKALVGSGHLSLAGNATLYLKPLFPSDADQFSGRITGEGKIIILSLTPTVVQSDEISPSPTIFTTMTVTPEITETADGEYQQKINQLKREVKKLQETQQQTAQKQKEIQEQVKKQEKRVSFLEEIVRKISSFLKRIFGFSSKKKSDPPSTTPTTIPDYYGRSTLGNCTTGGECLTSGCNGEICQSKVEEPLSSICVVPDKPLPKQLGYQCRCLAKKCQWVK
jgi:eight-cysteine-cluster-containing protein